MTLPTAAAVRAPVAAGRLLGAALLGTMGGIHWHLWQSGYRSIHVIGVLFLLNAVAGIGLGLAVLLVPGRWNAPAAALGAVTMAGTFAALLTSLNRPLFGFRESWKADLVHETLWVEAAGFVVLALLALVELRPVVQVRRTASRREGATGGVR